MEESLSALENAAKLASLKGLSRFTRFLDPAQAASAARIAQQHGCRFSCWGGFPDAERAIGCFHPFDENVFPEQYPIVCLHSSYSSKFCSISHRDLLGAFMALGLTRSCIGDIIISDRDVYLFSTEQMAGFIASSMTASGKVSLDFSILDEVPTMPEPEGTSFSAVVSSLRLDAVLASAYHLSRSEASECVRSGIVKVDHLPSERVDLVLKEGALLSVKGKGRVRLQSVNGMTKKQRIGISLFRYE